MKYCLLFKCYYAKRYYLLIFINIVLFGTDFEVSLSDDNDVIISSDY